MEKQKRLQQNEELATGQTKTQIKEKQKKKREADKEAKALKLQIKNIEKSINDLEEALEELQNQLCLESVYSNPEESNRVNKEIRSTESKLESLYEEWEKLAE